MHGWWFFSYWWLIFPLGAFVFGAWDRWLSYKRSRDRLEVIKSFAAQGKEPPPELMKELRGHMDPEEDDPGPPGYGPYGYWGSPRYARRAMRRYYRWGPYWQWRGAIITGAIAGAFWWASEYGDIPGTDGPFRLVAIIMTCVAAANLLSAILSSSFRDHGDK